jgi:hypothetical protein
MLISLENASDGSKTRFRFLQDRNAAETIETKKKYEWDEWANAANFSSLPALCAVTSFLALRAPCRRAAEDRDYAEAARCAAEPIVTRKKQRATRRGLWLAGTDLNHSYPLLLTRFVQVDGEERGQAEAALAPGVADFPGGGNQR